MEKIPSFTVDHKKLKRGVYVSRIDKCDDRCLVTTFDLRMKEPNREPVMNTAEIHTLEHIIATYLRNCRIKDKVIYFGPMGCRTGFYLIMKGNLKPAQISEWLIKAFQYAADFDGEIPGAAPEECGNYLDQNLPMAKYEAKKYLEVLKHLDISTTTYPEVKKK